MGKKAVITGGTGYIGSNLIRYLLSEEWTIYAICQPEFGYENIKDIKNKINIIEYNNDINTLISFFKDNNPDVVFHLAAAVIPNYKPEQISTLIQSNIQFGTEMLEAMKSSTCRLFINTGTYWQNYHSEQYNPVDLYAATKEAFEKIIVYYIDAFNFRAITLRLFDVYGENDTRPKLLNLLCNFIDNGKTLDISPGEQFLDMVHIKDVCSAYLQAYKLLKTKKSIINNVYGVYSGNKIQLKEIIFLVENILGKKINVNIGGKLYKDREVMYLSQTLEKLPDWTPEISLTEGIKRIILCNRN